MEATNSTTANNLLTSMMDGYQKQLNLVSEFYTNAFNSLTGQHKTLWNPTQNQSNLFFNNAGLKSLFSPFNGFVINNTIENPFKKMVKQISDYNHNLIMSLTNQFNNHSSENSTGINYQKLIEERNDASKNYINTLSETFNKQMEATLASNKKLQEETNKQLEEVLKSTQQFWSDTLKMKQNPPPLENFSKDGAATEKDKTFVKV